MGHYAHVMVAIDRSEKALAMARTALAVADAHGARLSILHVVDQRGLDDGQSLSVPLFGVGSGFAPVPADGSQTNPQPIAFDQDSRLVQRGRSYVDSVAASLGNPEVGRIAVASSAIGQAITAAVRAYHVDLLIAGGHGGGFFERLFPSAISQVVRDLPCDLLLIKVP